MFKLFHRETPEEKAEKEAQKAAEARRTKAEEEERQAELLRAQNSLIAERNDRLLPWNLEQKVAVVLNPVKIPFIIIAGIIGSVVELKIVDLTKDTDLWYRGLGTVVAYGAQCVVHRANYQNLIVSTDDSEQATSILQVLDKATQPLTDAWNATAHKVAANCTDGPNRTHCDLLPGGPLVNWSWADDFCGVEYDNLTGECRAPQAGFVYKHTSADDENSGWAGVTKMIPYVPHALVWMIFKLLFIPGYYVDRIHRYAVGTDPPPEPMLKILAEPTCTEDGKCGSLGPKFSKLGIVSKAVRFSLLPNTMILPLTSMRFVEQCRQEYIIYSANTTVGFALYCWLVFDLVQIVLLYATGLTVFKGRALNQMWYRCYKVHSVTLTIVALSFFIFDLCVCLRWKFWLGLEVLLSFSLNIDSTWGFSLDFAKTVASVVVMLDGVQFTILVMSLLCPVFLNKSARFLPARLRAWTDQPADINTTADLKHAEGDTQEADASRPLVLAAP